LVGEPEQEPKTKETKVHSIDEVRFEKEREHKALSRKIDAKKKTN